MELVQVSMMVPKEGKEVVDSVAAILEHFVLGKSLADAAALLPGVMAAVDKVGDIGEELKSKNNDELTAYLVQKVFSALKAKSEAEPVPVQL